MTVFAVCARYQGHSVSPWRVLMIHIPSSDRVARTPMLVIRSVRNELAVRLPSAVTEQAAPSNLAAPLRTRVKCGVRRILLTPCFGPQVSHGRGTSDVARAVWHPGPAAAHGVAWRVRRRPCPTAADPGAGAHPGLKSCSAAGIGAAIGSAQVGSDVKITLVFVALMPVCCCMLF